MVGEPAAAGLRFENRSYTGVLWYVCILTSMWLPYVLLSMIGWSLVNVLDSMLVRKYKEKPVILMWSQSLFSIVALLALGTFADIRTSWWPLLLVMGLSAYAADLFFFGVLDRMDVSVTNAAWPVLSVFLSIAGFALFHESWTALQAAGSLLIVGAVLLLSLHHPTGGSLGRTILLIIVLALAFVPSYIAKKAALEDGQQVIAVFFWLLIGRESIAFLFPWSRASYRKRIVHLVRVADAGFFAIGGLVIVSFLFGEFTGGLAFQAGPLSLVSVVSNIQPFVVIGLAWLMARFVPSYAAKELFSAQSVGIKLASFSIAFIGLALLAISQ